MEIIADTNILVRALVEDDPKQAEAAKKMLLEASVIAISAITLCELYWVLKRLYKLSKIEIAQAIRTLIKVENVRTDRSAAEAGLLFIEENGDFADGVLWYLGTILGGKTFVSFDQKAIHILNRIGAETKRL